MSIWNSCICPGDREDKRKNWRVVVRKGNYARNQRPRGEFHPSEFSEITCILCEASFRSKSKYVKELKDLEEVVCSSPYKGGIIIA